jgi:ecotropic viral integration site 5 protein
MPEEEAFAVLVKLMQEYRMRDMYKPTMAELGLCMYQLENLVQDFLTLFTTALSLPVACRLVEI